MGEPPKRQPLADDDAFLDRLSELDDGLSSDRGGITPQAGKSAGTNLPDSITAPFDALTTSDGAAPPRPAVSDASPRRRPLLELFPPKPTPSFPRAASPPAPAPRPRTAAGAPEIAAAAAEEHDAFYGLKEKAFGDAPDPRFFFHSTSHDAVVQELLTAIRRREGLVLLTGPDGIGKTTVCRVVLDEIDRRTLTSLLTDPIDTGEQLLTRILSDFGVVSGWSGGARKVTELRQTLQSFVDSLGSLEASALVVVDNAQKLPPAVFEEVRALCEAAHVSSRLQVIVVGDEALAALVRRKENRALHQRIAVRCALQPLGEDEIGDYVAHRLSVAGNDHVEFDEDALARLFALSRGVPRAINRIGDRVLRLGRERSAGIITDAIVNAAAVDVGVGRARVAQFLMRAAAAAIVIAFLFAGAAAAAWVFRDSVARAVAGWRMTPVPPAAPRRLPLPLPVPSVPELPSSSDNDARR